jgi:FKBP-type peptidyl-prolyl cis-trans isomerase FklB
LNPFGTKPGEIQENPMRRTLVTILLVGSLSVPALAGEEITLKTEKDKVSYTIGYNIGANFKKQSIDIDLDRLLRGMKDGLTGGKGLLSTAEQQEIMTAFQEKQKEKMEGIQKEAGVENREAGQKFLTENGKKSGVITLPSGLQYKVIADGNGPKPTAADTVKTHYKGTLLDGTEFDSSYSRGEPASFPVGGVIRGWTEALQLMAVGSKWELYIPSDLAYGDRGAGGMIAPGATLIFEVELLEIVTE